MQNNLAAPLLAWRYFNPQAEVFVQIFFNFDNILVFGFFGFFDFRIFLFGDQFFNLPNIQIFGNNLFGKSFGVVQAYQSAGMTGRQCSFTYQIFNGIGKIQKAQRIGHMTARFADNLCQSFLCMRKLIYQTLKTFRLLNCREVLTQQVFNQSNFKNFLIIHVFDDNRHRLQSGKFGRAPAALAGNDFKPAVFLANQKRLQYAFFLNGFNQRIQSLFVKILTRLKRARKKQIYIYPVVRGLCRLCRRIVQSFVYIELGVAKQRSQPPAKTFSFAAMSVFFRFAGVAQYIQIVKLLVF